MGLGLGVLRLSPDAFWRMTPRELALALGAALPASPAPMRRSELAALLRRFPDGPEVART
ncbi:MAG: phage tail assembly chaperone [Variibacter sp.]|nr:phage tail assembly chaperone [Variibacter sp.]